MISKNGRDGGLTIAARGLEKNYGDVRAVRGREDLEGDRALAHDVELVGALALLEEVRPRVELHVRGAAGDEREVLLLHPAEEGVLGEDRLEHAVDEVLPRGEVGAAAEGE